MSLIQSIRGLAEAIVPGGNLAEQAIKSGIWGGTTNAVNRVIQLSKVTILANLLSPKDFGLIGIGFLVLAVFKQFSHLGVEAALIQRNESDVDEYLDTVWLMRVGRGLLLAGIAFLVAPYAASFFAEPRASPIIRVLGLTPLVLGFRNPGVVYFRKDLQYHKRLIQVLSGTFVNFVVAVVLALLFRNVWALVFGSLSGTVTSLLVSYLIHEYRPKFEFSLNQAQELIDYGKWLTGSAIIFFLFFQGDDAFVGWFLGATALGFYQMAYRFSNAAATEISQVISNVVFPAYSQIQDAPENLRSAFYRTVRLTSFVSFPVSAGIVIIADPFVRIFLGEVWLPIVPVMQILAIWGLLRSLIKTAAPLFQAVGRPDIGTKLLAGQLVLLAILIYPATARFDLAGTGGAIVLSGVLYALPAYSILAVRTVDGSIGKYGQIIAIPFLNSILMAGVVWLLQRVFSTGIMIFDFVIIVVIAIVVYSLTTLAAVAFFSYEIRQEFRLIYENLA